MRPDDKKTGIQKQVKRGYSMSGNGKHPKGLQNDLLTVQNAQEFNRLKEAIDAMPDVRGEKISQLREAIGSGTYGIDAYAVAEKILEEFRCDVCSGKRNRPGKKQ